MAEPFEMRVETGKVREFARATGSSHPDYLAGDMPVSPVTFLMSATFWQGPASNPIPAGRDLSRVLHGGQEFEFPYGPPDAGTILTGQTHLGEPVVKEGKRGGSMTLVDLVTEYRDPGGRIVARVTSTSIETSKPTGGR